MFDRESDLPATSNRVIAWRIDRLRDAGFSDRFASALAGEARYDVHALLDLIDRSCPAELAARIVAPLGEARAMPTASQGRLTHRTADECSAVLVARCGKGANKTKSDARPASRVEESGGYASTRFERIVPIRVARTAGTGRRGVPRAVSILEVDPDLAEDLSEADLAIARRHLVADLKGYPRGTWIVGPDDFNHVANLGLLIVKGLLARQVTIGDHTSAELLGPGDVLQPWLRIGPDHSVAVEVGWEVIQAAQVAVLDRAFCARAGRWPEITAAISRRLLQRSHWLAFHLAVCNLRRVDDRLLLVFWHFADRWGTVTPEGVLLDIPLTHKLLAAVVSARRSSVSVAVGRLTDQGRVRPRRRSRWLLLGRPPAELRELHERASGSRRSPEKDESAEA